MNKEIKKLKDRIHALEEHNYHLEKEAQRYFDMIMNNIYLEEDNQELQERIEKAIDFIGNPLDNYWEEESRYLLNILEGEDNE